MATTAPELSTEIESLKDAVELIEPHEEGSHPEKDGLPIQPKEKKIEVSEDRQRHISPIKESSKKSTF